MNCPYCNSINCHSYSDRFVCFDCKRHIIFFEIPSEHQGVSIPSVLLTTDTKGVKYKHHLIGDGILTDAIINVDGKNRVFKGVPEIIIREGESIFGNQLIFNFLINSEIESYPASTPHKRLEIYFPKDKALELLQKIIDALKEEKCQ